MLEEVVEWLAGRISLEIRANNITQELIFFFPSTELSCPCFSDR